MKDHLYEIYYLDATGDRHLIDPDSAKLTREIQIDRLEPRQLELELDRAVPIRVNDVVLVKKAGRIVFRGYVKFYEINNKFKKTLTCYGMEDLLLYRYTNTYFWDNYSEPTLRKVLDHTIAAGVAPGLLAVANSYLMPGRPWTRYSPTSNVVWLDNCGTDSRMGNLPVYCLNDDGLVKLEEMSTVAAIAAVTSTSAKLFFRDTYSLYLNIGTAVSSWYWYESGGIFIENHKDTTVRLGDVNSTKADEVLNGTLLTNWNRIGDLILNVCKDHGVFVTFTDDENYTYLNLSDEEGRNPSDGVYTFYEEDLLDIEKEARSDPIPTCITGRGYGLQYYTRDDNLPDQVIAIESIIDYDDEWKDPDGELIEQVDDEFSEQVKTDNWSIKPARDDLIVMPGDWIKLKLEYEPEVFAKAVKIEDDCITGQLEIDLSEDRITEHDVWEFMQVAESGFIDEYPQTATDNVSANIKQVSTGYTGVEINEWGKITWAMPDDVVADAETLKERIMLTITVEQGDDAAIQEDLGMLHVQLAGPSYVHEFRIPNVTVNRQVQYQIPSIDVTDYIIDNFPTAAEAYIYIKFDTIETSLKTTNWVTGPGVLQFLKRAG